MKQQPLPKTEYEDIHMPKSTAVGIYISAFGTVACFGFVWHIMWMIVVSIIAIIVTFIIRGFNEDSEYTLTAAEVRKLEEARAEKIKTDEAHQHTVEDLGIWDLIKVVYAFAMDVIRNKRWRRA